VKRLALIAIGVCLLLPVLVLAAATNAIGGGSGLAEPTATALADIPPDYLLLYEQASVAYGVPWPVLAGIGKVECDHGRSPNPACWQEGAVNYAGAGGPMQFLASTWARYGVDANGDGQADRWDAADAIFAAANYLRASGAPADIAGALFAYNHSQAYVDEVLRWASIYAAEIGAGAAAAPTTAAATAVRFALAQIGTPYLWGGEGPGGFDCSGLVQAAYQAAGIALPRVAQQQYDAGPRLQPGEALQPGDLVFFGSDAHHVTHVGIVVGAGEMVDAPHSGATVRRESFNWPDYLGASRPSGR
jgi:cell wall-associated NlpC family hydrolase